MNKIPIKKHLLVFACMLMAVGGGSLLVSNPSVSANESSEEQTNQAAEKEAKKKLLAEQQQEALRKKQASAQQEQDKRKTKLDTARLKSCQGREKAIGNIMTRISSRGEKHLEKLNLISQRVQTFYTEKNLNVSNYDALVAEVNSKKAAAEAAVAAVKSTGADFKCDGSDPVGLGQLFKENHAKQTEALKQYKTAVKNLVAAVKRAALAVKEEEDN